MTSLYQKITAIVNELLRQIGLRILRRCIAPDFDAGTAVPPRHLVMRDGRLYICRRYHLGPWDGQDFEETTMDAVLNAMMLDSRFPDELYIKELEGEGGEQKFHKVVIRKSGDRYTIAVDQDREEKKWEYNV